MKKTLSLILALVMVATMFAAITVPTSAYDMAKTEGSVYNGTMDKTWYNAEDPKTEYTLYTAAELAGLADLVNTDGVQFLGVTIKLGADIIWNEGTFTLGKDNKTPVYNGALVPETINKWVPIGERAVANSKAYAADSKNFAGNFDGQGHVISGLYMNDEGTGAGLFTNFMGGYIKNLSIINSFFGAANRAGSFAAYVTTKDNAPFYFENLYSNAIIVLSKAANDCRSAGILGMYRYVGGDVAFTNVWYDGTIVAYAETRARHIGGIIGVACVDAAYVKSLTMENVLMTGAIYKFNTGATGELSDSTGGLIANTYTNNKQNEQTWTIKNCLVAVKDTNIKAESNLTEAPTGAFVGRYEKSTAILTIENSYYVPNGYFNNANGVQSADGYTVTINGQTVHTAAGARVEADVLATAKIAKFTEAKDLAAFELTETTAAIKGLRTGLVKNISIWDGTVDTSWFDINDIKSEYTLTTAAQLAGLGKIVDEYPKTADDKVQKPFDGVTVKLGANIVLNTGTFTLGADKKTPVYNGALISAENPVNVWNPIGVSANGANEAKVAEQNAFWGNFDGQGYVISGMYVNNPASQQLGLFATFAGKEFKNVVLTNSYVGAQSRSGSVIGFVANNNTQDVIVENVTSDAIVVVNHVGTGNSDVRSGGIIGMSRRVKVLTLKNLTYTGIISAVAAEDGGKARNYGGVIGVVVDDDGNVEGGPATTYENIVMKGAMYANSVNADPQTGAIVGNHCFGDFVMKNCVVDLKDTNMTLANGFAAEHVTDGVADLRGIVTTYSALIGCYEKGDTAGTIENCTWTHKGVFITGIGEFAVATTTINGQDKEAWLAATEDLAGGAHAYVDVAAKEATCDEAGNVAHKICACGSVVDAEGKEIADVVVPAKGHEYGEWKAPVAPTETEAGVLGHYQCSVCKKYFDADKNEIASIVGDPALGTTPVDPGTTPVDPGTTPVDPGTTPVDPGTTPVDPGTTPVDPGTTPVDPGTTPVDPGTTPTEPVNTTKAPDTTEPAKKKNCGGFTAVGAVLALVAVMGAAIVIKKK